MFFFGLFCVLMVTLHAVIRGTESDSRWYLLSSQSFIENKTFDLDAYAGRLGNFKDDYRIEMKKGHFYNYFPSGTSFFSIPFVYGALVLGKDMVQSKDNLDTQVFISVVLCMAVYALFYGICRCLLPPSSSFLIAFVSFLGSSLMSTMASALWSINFAVFFETLVLFILVRRSVGVDLRLNPYLLGVLLFSAFFCRPTAAIFIVFVLAYVWLKERKIFLHLCATMIVLLGVFIVFSLVLYDSIFPSYYWAQRVGGEFYWVSIPANLWSPSRGIFVFSPFFLLMVIGCFVYFKKLKGNVFFWGTVAVSFFNLLLIARYWHWWLGHSFGSRGLTELVPLWVLMTALLWKEVGSSQRTCIRVIITTLFLILGTAGIFINTVQGLYNVYAYYWNMRPNIDDFHEYVFDWRYPQFLANKNGHEERIRRHSEFLFQGGGEANGKIPTH